MPEIKYSVVHCGGGDVWLVFCTIELGGAFTTEDAAMAQAKEWHEKHPEAVVTLHRPSKRA